MPCRPARRARISMPRFSSLLSVGWVTALGWTVLSMVTRRRCFSSTAPPRCAAATLSASSTSSRSGPMRWRQRVIEERSSGRACWKKVSPQNSCAYARRRTEMAKKGHKPEEIVAKLRQGDVLVSQGRSVADAIRAIGVTEVTYYRRRQEYGGLKSDQVRRVKELEIENQRLRKAIADLTLDKLILQEAARGNF